MYCVYMHVNKTNGKKYIGMTMDVKRRWRLCEYKPDGKQNERPFYNALLKYGMNGFEHIILADNLSFEKACEVEIECIAKHETTNRRKGYNVAPGGNGGRVYKEHPRNMLGRHQTDYQKMHQRTFMLNERNNPMRNGKVVWGETHNHPRGFKGKTKSPEERTRISQTLKDKRHACIPIRAIYPNGEIVEYESTKAAQEVGLTKPVILKLLRSGEPFEIKVVNQYSKKNTHLVGIRFEYAETIPR